MDFKKFLGDVGLSAIAANVKSLLSSHTNDKNNPHKVTKSQVGLVNVDNTSDLNKPVSTAQQAALNDLEQTMESNVAAHSMVNQTYTDTKVETLRDELDEKIVQTDWNENDSTNMAYMKNKPFGQGEVETLLTLDNVTFYLGAGYYAYNLDSIETLSEKLPYGLESGKEYLVIWDGIEYRCIAKKDGNGYYENDTYIGSIDIFTGGELLTLDYPFYISYNAVETQTGPDTYGTIYNGCIYTPYENGNNVHSITIIDENITKIPDKFINFSNVESEIITGDKNTLTSANEYTDTKISESLKSNYDLWLSLGYEGTAEDFINFLKGRDGVDGKDGESVYETWLKQDGNAGKTESEFLDDITNDVTEKIKESMGTYATYTLDGNVLTITPI